MLKLILSCQIDHRSSMARVEPQSLTVGVDGTVHFFDLFALVALHVPVDRVLEVVVGYVQILVRSDGRWEHLQFVHSVVVVQADERILDVPHVVDLDLLQDVFDPQTLLLRDVSFAPAKDITVFG